MVACIPCFVGACGSTPPLRYYTLNDIAPENRAAPVSQGDPIRIDRVTIPSELDRWELVRRIDANQLKLQELDRWAAPLDEMIRRVLSIDLAARLPAGRVLDPREASSNNRYRSLSVDVQEFDGDAGCGVTLRVVWTVLRAHAENLRAAEEVRVPAGGTCPEALPAAMSLALAQLSDRIAAALSAPAGAS